MSYNDHKESLFLKPHIIILLQIFFIRGKRIFLLCKAFTVQGAENHSTQLRLNSSTLKRFIHSTKRKIA